VYPKSITIITSLGSFDPETLIASVRNLETDVHWVNLLDFQKSTAACGPGGFRGGILHFPAGGTELEAARRNFKINGIQLPLICLYDLEEEEVVRQTMVGLMDRIVPIQAGWESHLASEIKRWLAAMEEQESCYNPHCDLNQALSLKEHHALIIKKTLERCNGKVYQAARQLKIGKSTIYRMLQETEGKIEF